MQVEHYHEVLHNVRSGIRYHMRRQAFFERWHRITGVVSLVFSSAAVAVFFQDTWLASGAASVVAIAQAFDLMFETRKHADLHKQIKVRYTTLEAEIAPLLQLDKEQFKKFKAAIGSIEIDEPPVLKTLGALSQNDAATASGFKKEDNPDTFTDLNWFQRNFPNFFF